MATINKEFSLVVDTGSSVDKGNPAGQTKAHGLRFERSNTQAGVSPYDTVEWEVRDAVITNEKGEIIFEQKDVEVPASWSQMATNIVASKYFHGALGTDQRERSARQLIGRVVDSMTRWGREGGYFASEEDAETFRDELTFLLLNQYASFNSPVWFNAGIEAKPQCSACQPYHSRVLTTLGPMSIGEIVQKRLIGLPVYDGDGITQITAVKHNGRKPVYRIQLRDGHFVDATGDHLVCAHDSRRIKRLEWRRVDQLEAGMVLRLYPHAAETVTPPGDGREVAEAALAGWAQSDGFVGQYEEGTNRSLTVEFMTNGPEEHEWILGHLETALPGAQFHVRDVETEDSSLTARRIRLYGEVLRPFVEKYDLLPRGTDIGVPPVIFQASNDAVAAYLKGVFQAEGYVSKNEASTLLGFAVISEKWVKDLQVLLSRFGIYSRARRKKETREDRHDLWELAISIRSERKQFAKKIGFISERKSRLLYESLDLEGKICPEIRFAEIVTIEHLGEMNVYDIQTVSGQYLSEGVLVHNCFINSIEDTMESILTLAKTEGMLFKWGSGTGTNLSPLRSSRERLSGGGIASGPVSFMKGYDAFAGVIRSGGKTRRAAKMVIMNVDHPDIIDFIECKMREERKAWSLIDAGYDPSFNGEAYSSIFYQNANHSVRVTDAFMKAVIEDGEWVTPAVLTGEPLGRYPARDILRKIAESTHICGDPGMQFDTTINRWHTSKTSGRINASNPCSEYMYLDDSACNLASFNLMKFVKPSGQFDTASFRKAVDVMITAMEIIVDNASYPTEKIAKNSHAFRPLGLGYANLGALLMYLGIPYDSDKGRDTAAAITALMTGEAYLQSARIASVTGAFERYPENREPFLEVMEMHREATSRINPGRVQPELFQGARQAWDDAVETGRRYGYRNGQATVLAPTGTIGLMMDCDTTGVEPDLALVKFKKLVGGGVMKIVNQTVPSALTRLGYPSQESKEIIDYVHETGFIEGAPHLREENLPVFDCAVTPPGGCRAIHYLGHVKMMAAVQPFLSGAISKTVNMPQESTVEEIMQTYIEAWKLGLKAIAIYRDGSKRTQPLNTVGDRAATRRPGEPKAPVQNKMPVERPALTHKFRIAGHEGYITVGMYPDGKPGEIFINMSKEGSTVSGLMDAFARAISYALQYGVPLEVLVDKFCHTRFEPSGFTGNPEIPYAKSITDYIFRWLALKFLSPEQSAEAGVVRQPSARAPQPDAGAVEPQAAAAPAEEAADVLHLTSRRLFEDAPPCSVCGSIMVRNGSCYKCLNCGTTSGCS